MVSAKVDASSVLKGLEKFRASIGDAIDRALINGGASISKEAKENHRHTARSALLEGSVKGSVSGGVLTMTLDPSNSLPYAKYIHQGFKSWQPDPFMFEAVDKKAPSIGKSIEQAIDQEIKKAGL
jgi:hypothetical protein